MLDLARTLAQLFRQMRREGRPLADLELVRRAYDFGTPLHSGRYEVDGTPFACHGLGTASVMVQLDAPADLVAAAVLHNCYVTGDWGDGRGPGRSPARRARLRRVLGAGVDEWIVALGGLRRLGVVDATIARADEVDATDRWVMLLALADLLEKWDDGYITYSSEGRTDRNYVEANEETIVELARRLDAPHLASSLEAAFERVAHEEIPATLTLGRRHSEVVPASSWQVLPRVRLVSFVRDVVRYLKRRGRAFVR